VRSGIWFKW